jgi:electron transport complex protein RnfC
MGGPMMGFAILDLDTPVTKGTSGILALTGKELHSGKQTPCISCGGCISVCPLGLNPTRLFKLVDHLEYEQAAEEGLMDCKECGCCSFTCPAHIPLVQGMRLGKRIYVKNRRKAKT